jgi:hypothetical protein
MLVNYSVPSGYTMRTPTGLQGSKGGLLSPDLPTLRIPLDPSEGCKGWSQHERTAEYGEPQPRNHSTSTINARCSGMGSGTGATAGIRRSQGVWSTRNCSNESSIRMYCSGLPGQQRIQKRRSSQPFGIELALSARIQGQTNCGSGHVKSRIWDS